MNKKFSTLVAGLALCTAFTANAKVENGKVTAVTVDMGEPEQTSELPEKIEVDGTEYEFTGISMGNPHAVLFMDEIDSLDLETIGPKFEFHKRFPDRTNTEFVKVIDRTHVKCVSGSADPAKRWHVEQVPVRLPLHPFWQGIRRMRLRSSCWAAACRSAGTERRTACS